MKPGSLPWLRLFYSQPLRRGAHVHVGGRNARVLSASGGLVFVRMWTSGERVGVRPTELVAA